MLEVSGICKSYGKHRILNGVSFSAGPASAWESSEPMAAERPRFCRSWREPCVQTAGASASMGPRSGEGPGLPLTLRPMFPRRTR